MEQCWRNSETVIVEQWNGDGETAWWNSGIVMEEQCWLNGVGGTVWWNSDGGTVMVEQCGGTVWWKSGTVLWNSGTVLVEQGWCNSEIVMVEQSGGTLEQ